jgi:hypothetical protein
MNLRDQVEILLPNWQSWYPSVFEAAVDLGILRARVCPPGSLLLLQAFREQWSAVEQEPQDNKSLDRKNTDSDDDDTESDVERVMRLVTRLPPSDE